MPRGSLWSPARRVPVGDMARSGDLLGAPPPAPISIGDIALGTAAGSLLFWVGVGVLGLVLASASDDDAEPPPLPNPFARR